MAEDEIERLLREVQQQSGAGQPAQPAPSTSPAKQPGKEAAKSDGGGIGRVAFAGGSAVLLGVVGWAVGVFTPFIGGPSMGFGAALGAFVTGLVAGPPRWLSR